MIYRWGIRRSGGCLFLSDGDGSYGGAGVSPAAARILPAVGTGQSRGPTNLQLTSS